MRSLICFSSVLLVLIAGPDAWAYPAFDAFRICAAAYYANPANRKSVQYFIDANALTSEVWKYCVPPANATPEQKKLVEQARNIFAGKLGGLSSKETQYLHRDIYQWLMRIEALEPVRGTSRLTYTASAADKIKASLVKEHFMPGSWASAPTAPASTPPTAPTAGCKPQGMWQAIRNFLSE